MWGAIFGIAASLPALIDLLEKFVSWLSDEIQKAKTKKANEAMDQAIDKAKADKDTSEIDHLFDNDKEVKK